MRIRNWIVISAVVLAFGVMLSGYMTYRAISAAECAWNPEHPGCKTAKEDCERNRCEDPDIGSL